MIYHIYLLIDPRNGKVRYVGKTTNPTNRFKNHCCPKGHGAVRKRHWIEKLRKRDLIPIMEIVAEIEGFEYATVMERAVMLYHSGTCYNKHNNPNSYVNNQINL